MKGFNRNKLKAYKPQMISEGLLREYAVLVPIVVNHEGMHLLFERRSKLVSQAGDYCFPGGKVEQDESIQEAALRETEEELKIHGEQIDLLAQGDSIFTPYNLLVHSFIGLIYDYQNTYNEQEVDQVQWISLDDLLLLKPQRYQLSVETTMPDDFPYELIEKGREYTFSPVERSVLFYEIDGVVIWGLSALILQSALKIIKESLVEY